MKHRLLALVVIAVLVGLALLVGTGAKPISPQHRVAQVTTRAELLELTNRERVRNSIAPLPEDKLMDESAQLKAVDEQQNGYFGHENPVTGKRGGSYAIEQEPSCKRVQENLTENVYVNDAKHAVAAWMISPAHRAALLDPSNTSVGFGIAGDQIVAHYCMK